MSQLYSDLVDKIDEFFSHTSITRTECDEVACRKFGGDIEPVPVQGATSYTVVAGLVP